MNVRKVRRRLVGLAGALALAGGVGCSAASTVWITDGKLPLGQWGGDSAAMIVSDASVHLHIACTYGDVDGRIALDGGGNFDVQGSYLLRAFPIAVGPTLPARFTGHVSNGTATILVTVNDTIQKTTVVRGPVVVSLGREPKLMPCPICRRPIITAWRDLDPFARWTATAANAASSPTFRAGPVIETTTRALPAFGERVGTH